MQNAAAQRVAFYVYLAGFTSNAPAWCFAAYLPAYQYSACGFVRSSTTN